MIKYSVITPVFNREDCIERCLESVTRNIRDRTDVEHVVVDDGSSDSTSSIIKKYAKKHTHVHYIIFTQNRGTNAARNAAIATAKGLYCVFLDSDDYWDDCAMTVIDESISAHPKICHFCFAPDDMLSTYESNPMLHGQKNVILSFEDFLMGRISGDFVHVMKTNVVRRYPFDEQLRIYEGIFFLSFYKEAGKILYVNRVISHRERGRNDSVSYDFLRTNREAVKRRIIAEEIFEERFINDIARVEGGDNLLLRHQIELIENYLLLQDYTKAHKLITEVHEVRKLKVPSRLRTISKWHLGGIYYHALRLFLFMKYRLLSKKLK